MAKQYQEYIKTPTESLSITTNGTYDVTEKAQVVVDAQLPTETFNVTPSTSQQTITPSEGHVFSSGTVQAIPVSPLDNTIISGSAYEEATGDYAWRSTVQVPAGYHAAQTLIKDFSDIFPAPETEGTADKMLLGYELFNHEGKKITGTMTNNATATVTLDENTTSYTVPQGYHTGSDTVSHTIGSQGDVSVTKSISGNTATINASQTDSTGYIVGTTKTNSTTVTAAELVSGSVTITTNTTTDVTNLSSVITNVSQSIPTDIATDADMEAVLIDANIGKAYRFTGTTGTYKNGDIYIVE